MIRKGDRRVEARREEQLSTVHVNMGGRGLKYPVRF